MNQLHNRHIYSIILDNINRGVEQGLYRKEINPDIIAKIYIANTSPGFHLDLFPKTTYDLEALVREYTVYHIHGIATPKGLEMLSEYQDARLNNID